MEFSSSALRERHQKVKTDQNPFSGFSISRFNFFILVGFINNSANSIGRKTLSLTLSTAMTEEETLKIFRSVASFMKSR